MVLYRSSRNGGEPRKIGPCVSVRDAAILAAADAGRRLRRAHNLATGTLAAWDVPGGDAYLLERE